MRRVPSAPRAGAIIRLGEVTSTQAIAFELAERGAPDRTVVVADHQTAGRGRRGRIWHDAPGQNLLVSILARPQLAWRCLPTLSFAAAAAVGEALETVAGLRARLKWPNDVVVNGRKIAGILLESRPAETPVVVVGVGVNVAQASFPSGIAARATSIALETDRAIDREALLQALLDAFDRWRGRLEREGFAALREHWLALSATIGQHVTVDEVSGRAVDLDLDGALVLEDGAARRRVIAGEISAAAPTTLD